MHHAVHRDLVAGINARKGIDGFFGGSECDRTGFTGIELEEMANGITLFEDRTALGGDVTRTDTLGPMHHVGEYLHAATGLGEARLWGWAWGRRFQALPSDAHPFGRQSEPH